MAIRRETSPELESGFPSMGSQRQAEARERQAERERGSVCKLYLQRVNFLRWDGGRKGEIKNESVDCM